MIQSKKELYKTVLSGQPVTLNKLQLLYLFGLARGKMRNLPGGENNKQSDELTDKFIEESLTQELETWCSQFGFSCRANGMTSGFSVRLNGGNS